MAADIFVRCNGHGSPLENFHYWPFYGPDLFAKSWQHFIARPGPLWRVLLEAAGATNSVGNCQYFAPSKSMGKSWEKLLAVRRDKPTFK
jgi:hypothetical protein